MIDYPTFLANVTDDDIRMLNLIALKQTIATQSATEADQYVVELTRLYTNGLLVRAERAWERRDGIDWQIFDAVIEPLAVTYLIQMQMDRIKLSRTPIPAA